jgi:hypothetical protein
MLTLALVLLMNPELLCAAVVATSLIMAHKS